MHELPFPVKEKINKTSPDHIDSSSRTSNTFNKLTTHITKLGFSPTASKLLALQFVDAHLGGRTNTTGGIDIAIFSDHGIDISESINALTNTFTHWSRVNPVSATTDGLFGFSEHGFATPGVITRDTTQLVFVENATEIEHKPATLFKEVIDTKTLPFTGRHGQTELTSPSNLTFISHTKTNTTTNTPLIHNPPLHPTILNSVDIPIKIPPNKASMHAHSSVASEKYVPGKIHSTITALTQTELQWVELGVNRVKNAKGIFIEKSSQTSDDSMYTPTPKRLEKTLMKLSEAHARTRQSPIVTHEDVNTALKLMFQALSQFNLGWGAENTHSKKPEN